MFVSVVTLNSQLKVISIKGEKVSVVGIFYMISSIHFSFTIAERESYGEDIADTETERSTGHSDEDKYDDSFINDADLEIIPPSPVSGGGGILCYFSLFSVNIHELDIKVKFWDISTNVKYPIK